MTGLHQVERVMGIPVSVHLADDLPYATLTGLADEMFSWLRRVDSVFSTYQPDSEVSRLRRGDLRLDGCSVQVRTVLERCADLWRTTDGYFDAYATGDLDPSGYVKGWAVEVASDLLVAGGSVNHCINAGGDVRIRGCPHPADAWRVGVRHPWEPLAVCLVITGTDLAVATSGTYERGCHIIDPRRRMPADRLRSVTVVGPDLGVADAYATAAVAMGDAALEWLARLDGYESAVVTEDGRLFRSAGLPTG